MASHAGTLVDLVRRQAERYRHKVAFSFSYDGADQDAGVLTYDELDRKARGIAAGLQRHGAAGERVLVVCRPGLDFITGFFGCLYAGAIAVPVHQKLAPRLSVIVPDADARIALTAAETQASTRATVGAVAGCPDQWLLTDAPAAAAEDWVPPVIDADAPTMIQYTSGSTRLPKGVLLTHANLMHNVAAIQQAWDGDDSAVGVYWLPPHHDMGLIGGILETLYVGFTTYLMSPTAFIKRPMRWLEVISRHRGVITAAPNFAYDKCVATSTPAERAALDLSSLTTAMNGAEPVRAATLTAFADAFAPAGFRLQSFYPVYGLAEASLLVSGGSQAGMPGVRHVDRAALGTDRVVDIAATDPGAAPIVGCGEPRGGQRVLVVDPVTRRPCGTDEIGELWLAGPSVAAGYWRRPEETQQTFAGYLDAATGEPPNGPYLRTGDLGFCCAGEVFITGRVKDLVVIDGHNYYPNDIEATVQACHPVLASGRGAVFAVNPGPHTVEQLVAVQEVDRDHAGDVELGGVIDTVRAAISRHHGVDAHAVVLVEPLSLPTTSSGKIQRGQCRQQFTDGALAVVTDWRAPVAVPSHAELEAAAQAVRLLNVAAPRPWGSR